MSDETQQEAPKDLRDARDRALERAAELEAERDAAVSGLREFKAQTLFGNEKHAELFLRANPDAEVTAEAVKTFRNEYGLVTEAGTPAPAEESKPDPGAGLAPLGEAAGAGTSGAAPAAQPKMSREDFEQLLATDPQAAAEAYVKGIAPRSNLNVQARALVEKGIIDH